MRKAELTNDRLEIAGLQKAAKLSKVTRSIGY